MKQILHAPLDIAGQAGLICEKLVENGWFASSYNYFPTYFQYKNSSIITDAYQLQKMFPASLSYFDIYHFHNSLSFYSDYRDLPVLKDHGKKVIMHHRGNDVRNSVKAKIGKNYVNPYVMTHSSLSDQKIHKNLSILSKYVDIAIVQDGELLHFVKDYYPHVRIVPRMIRTDRMPIHFPNPKKRKPLVVHAPTDRDFKGTDRIVQTVRELQKSLSFDFALIEKRTHQAAMERMRNADLVIDQIRCGSFGNVSVEAMAMGKPVIAYVRNDLLPMYQGQLPIVSANPDNLLERLKELIMTPELRYTLGQQGRKYTEEFHDASKVVSMLIDIYKSLYKVGFH